MKYYLSIYLLFMMATTKAQSINTSIGFAGFGSPIDGYYLSFDYDIKLNKTFSIAPTFTFVSNMKNKKGSFTYLSDSNTLKYNDLTTNWVHQAGIAELYFYLHPFNIFKKINSEKNELKMGMGFGMSAYTKVFFNKHNSEDIRAGSTYGIIPSYSLKLIYNYHIKNYFFGMTLGVTDQMADGPSLIGINLGAKFK